MSSTTEHEIVIVGGGHAGLLAALALRAADFDVVVADPAGPASQPLSGRSLALLAGSRVLAERMGIWRHLHAIIHPVRRVDVRDVASGGQVVYRSRDIGREPLAYGVINEELRASLAAALPVDIWRLSSASGLPERGCVRLADGRELWARLVIGADGRASRVRQLAGIALERKRYGQSALSLIVEHERGSRETVLERLRPEGPLATLPLGSHRSGITWVEKEAEAGRIAAAGESGILSRLDGLLGAELGPCRLVSPVQLYPLGAQHARRYVAPGIALIGDAAHGVHPIHAQGFNMGIADIACLVDLLVDARARRQDIGGEVLCRYEQRRRPESASRLRLTDTLNRLYSNDLLPLRPARRLLLDLLDGAPPLRRRAIRHGMQLAS